jgi:hypothetical protein
MSILLSEPHEYWRWRNHKPTYADFKKEMWVELWSATSIEGAWQGRKRHERVPVARDQLSTAMLDYGKCAEAVIFQLENEVGVIEWQGPLQERHRLEISVRFSGVPRTIPQLLRERSLKVGWDEPAHFPLALSWTLLRC